MRTIRRVYLYAVALISLEVVLWGLVGLARSILSSLNVFQAGAAQLAQALALVLVGVPVFAFHWLMANRLAQRDPEEHSAGLRAAFLYGVLLGTLIPVVQNILALVNRPVLSGLRLASARAFVGGTQIWSDNVIAIVMNLLVAAYFLTVLRADWKAMGTPENFSNLRRIYRWVWVLYGLGLTVTGLNQVLRFLLTIRSELLAPEITGYWAVNGMVVTLVGAPLWAYSWLSLQKTLSEAGERSSLLRLGLLYLLSLSGAVVTLSSGGVIVDAILRLFFGVQESFQVLLQALTNPLAVCIPFLGIWLYYGHWLNATMAEVADTPRRAGMRRVYHSILSALGLIVTFIGLALLLAYLVDMVFLSTSWGGQWGVRLSGSLALLVVGLPLWLVTWRSLQAEALTVGDAGDHARRSITRKITLYLALFAGVIGGMATAVALLNKVLQALFGGDSYQLAQSVLKSLTLLVLFIGLGLYHGLLLGRDGKRAAGALSALHQAYAVLILDPGDGFGVAILDAIHKATPTLPVELWPAKEAPGAGINPKAVVLASDVAFSPVPALRKWLEKYEGLRLVVPRPAQGWIVVGQPAHLAATQAAQTLRQLAEGQANHPAGVPGWQIAVYILGALFGLPVLASIIGAILSAFMR